MPAVREGPEQGTAERQTWDTRLKVPPTPPFTALVSLPASVCGLSGAAVPQPRHVAVALFKADVRRGTQGQCAGERRQIHLELPTGHQLPGQPQVQEGSKTARDSGPLPATL